MQSCYFFSKCWLLSASKMGTFLSPGGITESLRGYKEIREAEGHNSLSMTFTYFSQPQEKEYANKPREQTIIYPCEVEQSHRAQTLVPGETAQRGAVLTAFIWLYDEYSCLSKQGQITSKPSWWCLPVVLPWTPSHPPPWHWSTLSDHRTQLISMM